MKAMIQVRCVGCRSVRDVSEAESRGLTKSMSIPMCKCGLPMLVEKVEGKMKERRELYRPQGDKS